MTTEGPEKERSEKEFDAVAMKRRAAKAIRERLRGRSREERRAFWAERTEALRRRQAERSG